MATFRVEIGTIQAGDWSASAGQTFEADPVEVEGLLKEGKISVVGQKAVETWPAGKPLSENEKQSAGPSKYEGLSRDEMYALLNERGVNPSKLCNNRQLVRMLEKSETQAEKTAETAE